MEGAATPSARWFALLGVLLVQQAVQADDRSAAKIVSRHGGCSRAIPALESAYEDSGDRSILLQLARCHEAHGDRDTAVVYYRRLADQPPDEPAGREARRELQRLVPADPHTPATGRLGSGAPTRLEGNAPAPKPGAWGFRASLGPGLALPTGTYDDVVQPSLLVAGRLGAEHTWDRNGIGPGLRFDYVRWSLDGSSSRLWPRAGRARREARPTSASTFAHPCTASGSSRTLPREQGSTGTAGATPTTMVAAWGST
jgi:hypothetical protein